MIQRKLPMPWQLADFLYTIKVTLMWDDEERQIQQPCGPVLMPDEVENARVVLVPHDSRDMPCGPPLTWDQECDSGRGMWVQFDPELHGIPVTTPQKIDRLDGTGLDSLPEALGFDGVGEVDQKMADLAEQIDQMQVANDESNAAPEVDEGTKVVEPEEASVEDDPAPELTPVEPKDVVEEWFEDDDEADDEVTSD